MKTVVTIEFDTELGSVHIESKDYFEVDKDNPYVTCYARWFDETLPMWTDDPEYNLMYLRNQEKYFNDILKARGCVFLNDVYKSLGFSIIKAGQIVGWVYDPSRRIDFGLTEKRNSDFLNGLTPNVLLDFNVDGNILDRL